MSASDAIGPHECRAHELPVGVYILHGEELCLITTSPITREGTTRFRLDRDGLTEYAEYHASRLVVFYRTARTDGGQA